MIKRKNLLKIKERMEVYNKIDNQGLPNKDDPFP